MSTNLSLTAEAEIKDYTDAMVAVRRLALQDTNFRSERGMQNRILPATS